MPKKGRRFIFYGAFGTKSKARGAERKHKGSFIRRVKVRGNTRYVVMKPR